MKCANKLSSSSTDMSPFERFFEMESPYSNGDSTAEVRATSGKSLSLVDYRRKIAPHIKKMFGSLRNRCMESSSWNGSYIHGRTCKKAVSIDVNRQVPAGLIRNHTNYRPPENWKTDLFRNLEAMRQEQLMTENRRRKFRQIYQQSQRKAPHETRSVEKSNPQTPPMNEYMIHMIKDALQAPPSEVLVEISRQAVTRTDLETLLGLNWLNDAIINVYLNLIVKRSEQNTALPKVYAFNTFFLTRYVEMGYGAVRRWTRRDDIFANDILLVPVHLGMHWCMAVIDLRSRQIKYMDSMGGRNDECLGTLLDYLAQEMEDKKKNRLNFDEWHMTNIQNLPQQQNGSDCGMFALKYADYAALDAKLNFSQSDMPYFRRRMMFEILKSEIIPQGYGL